MARYLAFNSLTSVDLSKMNKKFNYLILRVGLVAFALITASNVLAQKTKNRWRSQNVDTLTVDTLTVDALEVDSSKCTLIPIPEKTEEGDFIIKMDSAITSIYLEASEKEPVLNGYRIQIYFGDLESARSVRAKCRKQLNHNRIYLESLPPNYTVTLGDYRNRWEAELALTKLKRRYPDAILMQSEIKLPDLK